MWPEKACTKTKVAFGGNGDQVQMKAKQGVAGCHDLAFLSMLVISLQISDRNNRREGSLCSQFVVNPLHHGQRGCVCG